ncbi:hypothetical protein OV208_20330 [Corallococcus sp. bb12-1]|uniref:hypothetical protein n=1 Tax=Corallococcus sp. bb12-1 TaxID=2996784 RepID=UPI002271CF1E|nr:hypothetical protein [Corallococcus sp. bb12-1]MCY1043678.1 hypothetical protein [Corallococcus sp. bb12-1]
MGTFVLGLGGVLPPSAEACGGPVCQGKDVRIARSATGDVPANVPALVAVHLFRRTLDTGSVRLLTAEGAPVEATVTSGALGSAALVPTEPLVPGNTYRMEVASPCTHESQTEAATFTVGPALPLPGVSGVLEAGTEQHGPLQVYGGAMCSVEVEGSTRVLGFTPSPELVPFLPWVHWTLKVDGQPWAQAEHGAVGPTGEFTVANRLIFTRDLLRLFTVCDDSAAVERPSDPGLAPGVHVATLQPVLEHSGIALPPMEVSFTQTCPKAPDPTDPTDPTDPVDPTDPTDPVDPAPKEEGCAQAGGGLTAMGLLTTLQLWRYRSRTRRT